MTSATKAVPTQHGQFSPLICLQKVLVGHTTDSVNSRIFKFKSDDRVPIPEEYYIVAQQSRVKAKLEEISEAEMPRRHADGLDTTQPTGYLLPRELWRSRKQQRPYLALELVFLF